MGDDRAPAPRPDDEDPQHRASVPAPSASASLFAAMFGLLMVFNVIWDATHADYSNPTVTIFLGSGSLLILGVDVGRIIGRK